MRLSLGAALAARDCHQKPALRGTQASSIPHGYTKPSSESGVFPQAKLHFWDLDLVYFLSQKFLKRPRAIPREATSTETLPDLSVWGAIAIAIKYLVGI